MKTNFTLLVVIAAVLSGIVTSCGPVLYTNVGHNVPLLQKKGEMSFVAGSGQAIGENFIYGSEVVSGLCVQAAAAVGTNTAVISSFYAMEGGNDWSGIGTYFEMGVGKFKSNEKRNMIGEVFVGSGFGSLKNNSGLESINIKYVKPFIQPSGGYSSKYFDIALTPRIALVSYTSISSDLSDSDIQLALNDFWHKKKNTLVIEPGVTIRSGYKNVKLQLQHSFTSFSYDSDKYSPVYGNFFSLSAYVLISDRWAHK